MSDEEGYSRRTFLKTLSAGIIATSATSEAAAQNNQVKSHTFNSQPINLKDETKNDFNYVENYDEIPETFTVNKKTITTKNSLITYKHENPELEKYDWGKEDPKSRKIAILSTPKTNIKWQERNPLALIKGGDFIKHQEDLLERKKVLEEGEWLQRPQLVKSKEKEIFGKDTTLDSFIGIKRNEDSRITYLFHISKTIREDDHIFLTSVQKRLTPKDFEVDSQPLIGSNGLMSEKNLEERREWTNIIFDSLESNSSTLIPSLNFKNPKLVQKVTDSEVVKPASGSYQLTQTIHNIVDPPLVAGDHTAAVFENLTSSGNISQLSGRVTIEVIRKYKSGKTKTDTFSMYENTIKDIVNNKIDPYIHFHKRSNFPYSNNVPVFKYDQNIEKVKIRIGSQNSTIKQSEVTLEKDKDFYLFQIPTLRVGFVQLQDRKAKNGTPRYGDQNGKVKKYRESVQYAVKYLKRVYPGDLIAFRHDKPVLSKKKTNIAQKVQPISTDLSHAQSSIQGKLNSSKPLNGKFVASPKGKSPSISSLRNNGYNAIVVIVPGENPNTNENYFSINSPNTPETGGVHLPNPHLTTAVLELGDPDATEESVGVTAAHELGHAFVKWGYRDLNHKDSKESPLAQRKVRNHEIKTKIKNSNGNKVDQYIDSDHARDIASDHDKTTFKNGKKKTLIDTPRDPPGLTSIGFDLTNGKFDLVSDWVFSNGDFNPGNNPNQYNIRNHSYMSYHHRSGSMWADSRHQGNLIFSEYNTKPPYTPIPPYQLKIAAKINEEVIHKIQTRVYEITDKAIEMLNLSNSSENIESEDMLVELISPEEEVLEETWISKGIEIQEVGNAEDLVSFSVPFPQNTAKIRLTDELGEKIINPLKWVIEDAISRVPRQAFRESPQEIRYMINDRLERLDELMSEHEYEEAYELLEEEIAYLIDETVSEDIETKLGQPTKPELFDLLERVGERLEVLSKER